MANVDLLISVDDSHLDRIPEVVQNLQSAGLDVKQSMEKLGVITGSIDSVKMKSLSEVKGVLSIEPSREFQLAPPNSDVQ